MSTSVSLCIIGTNTHRLWGRPLPERIAIQFARAGINHVISEKDLVMAKGDLILVRADAVLDAPIINLLAENTHRLVLSQDNTPLAARVPGAKAPDAIAVLNGQSAAESLTDIPASAPGDLDASYWKALRKRETPYAMAYDPARKQEIEWRSFMGTYKGATDFVTKHIWPRPAFIVTRWLADTFVTPNMVTSLSAIFTILAFIFFLRGEWALGLVSAWSMTFLDTVDGKLARTTLTSSPWGNVFDHGIDLVHPPFWYWAWGAGLASTPHALAPQTLWWTLAVIIGGYVLQRLLEGISISLLGLEIHIWRRIDSAFRQITARRNPNLVLLTLGAIFGRPDLGLIAVALWTGLCFMLHLLQLAHALVVRIQTGPLQSWLTGDSR